MPPADAPAVVGVLRVPPADQVVPSNSSLTPVFPEPVVVLPEHMMASVVLLPLPVPDILCLMDVASDQEVPL